MPAYLIANIEVTNPDGYRGYTEQVGATIAAHGGRFSPEAAVSGFSKATGNHNDS